MTIKELNEELKKLKEQIDKLDITLYKVEDAVLDMQKNLKIHDGLFNETKDLINKAEREIDMLKRWRG